MKGAYIVTLYVDRAGEHRWRMKAPNGRIVADGGEGYKTRGGALNAAKRLVAAKLVLKVEEQG